MKHDELVKALRCCADAACGICPYSEDDRHCGASKLAYDAAAAIEELQAELEQKNRDIAVLQKCYQIADEAVDKALEPKRGEWTWIQIANGGHYKGCSVCHAPMPTDSMLDYLDDEDCEFCYSCGANMGVQDADT